jgi:hypothetical protein
VGASDGYIGGPPSWVLLKCTRLDAAGAVPRQYHQRSSRPMAHAAKLVYKVSSS